MPTVAVDPDELRSLVGRDVPEDELIADLFGLGLELEGRTDAGAFELEFAPDRLDRLSVEGIARSLRYQYGIDEGVDVPSTNDPEWAAIVEPSVPEARPYVTAFIAREVDLGDGTLESLIDLQERLHATMGRGRSKGAIGLHDLTMLKGTSTASAEKAIRYVGIEGDGDRFVPLESDREFIPAEVIEDHHIASEYGYLVDDYERFPAIYDDIGLFSLPPIINGARTRVTTETHALLVELTGTDQWTIDRMAAILAYALDARGARLESVTVSYEDRELIRPDFSVRTKRVTHARIETVLGIELTSETVLELCGRAGLDAEPTAEGDAYDVSVPPYRTDVLHPIDVIDDLGRAYGFNDLSARYPEVGTIGGRTLDSRARDAVREQLIGAGFQDLVNFHLIGHERNFDRLDLEPDTDDYGGGRPARIAEPYSEEYELLRTWALPSLMQVLENNTHHPYPQRLAEVGLVAEVDSSEPTGVAEHRAVAGVVAESEVGYEDARAVLQFLASEHDRGLATPPIEHPTFLDGRVAAIELDGTRAGVLGEVHPRVLERHDLEVPVAAFECRLSELAERA